MVQESGHRREAVGEVSRGWLWSGGEGDGEQGKEGRVRREKGGVIG